jgi:single-strand selective monofunctional uracil DNA glycosylase
VKDPLDIAQRLSRQVARLRFTAPVTHVYNPLTYARRAHAAYVERYGRGRRQVVLLGMNPGPWGMAQTGVPFGDPTLVREWLDIDEPVGKPARQHPKRPVCGFASLRAEVSGTRLWGWARDRFGTPERFFARFYVANYCPLVFMEASGRNLTPDKLKAHEREPLFLRCDRALAELVQYFQPDWLIGVGAFTCARARLVLADTGVRVGRILHPSPASPAANRGWAAQATRELRALGIEV